MTLWMTVVLSPLLINPDILSFKFSSEEPDGSLSAGWKPQPALFIFKIAWKFYEHTNEHTPPIKKAGRHGIFIESWSRKFNSRLIQFEVKPRETRGLTSIKESYLTRF